MAHKRFFIYPALLAICYLLGVTWVSDWQTGDLRTQLLYCICVFVLL